jgi:hypothetical protein
MPGKTPPIALYPANASPKLDLALFKNPPAIYRGTPFWSWNNRLDRAQLLRQIEQFKQMGFGGFMIHSRTGLATPYLGDEYMQHVVACTEKAAKEQMLSWLYDEDRWPSGFAGGLVTEDQQYRARHLLWTITPLEGGELLGRYEVVLKHGFLAKYRRLKDSAKPRGNGKGRVWHAYLETQQESSWYNNQTYVDTFSAEATRRFIEVTHERFRAALGDHFGNVIPAIFTDEPQFTKKMTFVRSDDTRDILMPWTGDFVETFKQTYKQDILDHLPQLFWDLPDHAPSLARWRYHDHTAERFAAAFGDVIGQWCAQHSIALTGHMLGEAVLFSQTRGIGEGMRPLRGFHLPGIDMLQDKMELTTAKQSQSVAHQYGRPGVLSELYGVTNWDFDFVGHKAQGDWQSALGVTVRVPHLAWVSMAGESKRDYPAAIGYQSPWYLEYKLIEDHFSRINTVLTRGRPLVRVGVIHPIESYWLCFGPIETNQPEMEEREQNFRDITSWLAFSLIDYDFISEGLLPTQAAKSNAKTFAVGQMQYDVIVVPAMRTIRSTTLKRLEEFARAGGTVIFAGEVPALVDAKPSSAAQRLAKRSVTVAFNRRQIVEALEPFREVAIRHADGSPADSILHQARIDGKDLQLFFCNTDRESPRTGARIRVRGKWDVTVLDTMTGTTDVWPALVEGNETSIRWDFAAHGHALMTLSPATKRAAAAVEVATIETKKWTEVGRLRDPVPITLSEPNVLLLDQAEWRIDNGQWQAVEEILRLDNQVRERLKLPMRSGRIAQPWTDNEPAPVVAQLQLRFAIHSDVDVRWAQLALEDPRRAVIHFDHQHVPGDVIGWWVDEAIHTVRLPPFMAGEHTLTVTIPFTRRTDLEWCYLLGDFGVNVSGRGAKLTDPARTLAFGDWTTQGLPFYAGNVTYHCTIDGDGSDIAIEVARFKNPLLSINLDRKAAGKIAFAPFLLELGKVTGRHKLDIIAYGNRVNAFGAVHNANEKLTWYGPPAWRQTGVNWSYEYQLRRMGILVAPTIKKLQS